jgi:hypothetical protein
MTEGNHDGAPEGRFFSKKDGPAVPCGHRIRVTGRPARWGSSTDATVA